MLTPKPKPAPSPAPKPKKSDVCAIPEEKDLEVVKKELTRRSIDLGKKALATDDVKLARKLQVEQKKITLLLMDINKKLKNRLKG